MDLFRRCCFHDESDPAAVYQIGGRHVLLAVENVDPHETKDGDKDG
jgi:hypothetical protein